MSPKTSNQDNLQPYQPFLPQDEREAIQELVTELSPRRKSAGKPQVKTDTARPQGPRIVVPGLGKVTLVIH